MPDHNYPFCAYNAQYFKLEIFNQWGGIVFNREIYSPTCCPFRAKSNNSDPTIPSINWDGIANHDVNYTWLEQLLGQIEAHNGSRVSDGTYFYVLNLSGCSASQSFNGFMTVLGGGHSMIVPAPIPDTPDSSEVLRSFNQPLNDNISGPELIMYPNPANSSITVVMSDNTFTESEYNFVVFNYLGQIVNERNYITNQLNTIDINTFENGFYSIKISYENQTFTKTFIKSE